MDDNNESQTSTQTDTSTKLSRNRDIGISRFFGGLTALFTILLPLIYFWITSNEKISLAQFAVATEQIRVSAEQIQYITKRMNDSDKERDLYKTEMISAQQGERACRQELAKVKK